jgi:hypothetical protein
VDPRAFNVGNIIYRSEGHIGFVAIVLHIEDWNLSADGKILTIHRADDTPRGKMEADMVVRQELADAERSVCQEPVRRCPASL